MPSTRNSSGRRGWVILAPLLAILGVFTWLALHGDRAQATGESERTQAGARVTFSSLKDWNLKAENLSPRGRSSLYFPLEPGFRYIMERPNHPSGHSRVEVLVLDKTEQFDVPGIGKFDSAVVQEEEFSDGVLEQRVEKWLCLDKSTNHVYSLGEVRWEMDKMGRKVLAGTWRAGDPDGNGITEPGLLMPQPFVVGDRYVVGHEAERSGYAENMETGISITVPAGRFNDCVRTREKNLTNPSDVTDKWWCPGVGIVKDQSVGELVASDALAHTDMASFGKNHPEDRAQTTAPVAKISSSQATEIALREVPGKVTSMEIERVGQHDVYTVEIIADKDAVETDVFVDIESGKVVGTDR